MEGKFTLKDVKSLQQISDLYNIPVPTLMTRLTSKKRNLIEDVDYKRMGKGQGIIFSPVGIEKIIRR